MFQTSIPGTCDFHKKSIVKSLALIFTLGFTLSAAGQKNMQDIIQRSMQANDEDWQAAPEYSYLKLERHEGETRTYEVKMILGSPYQRLVAVNGNPLSPAEQAKEQQSAEEVTAQRLGESQAEREKRIAKYEKERSHDHLLMDEMAKAFDFKLVGERNSGGSDVYVLKATPNPNYQPPNIETKVLTAMQGELWIDKKTFKWVKVEAEVVRPVLIAGFLACVEKGTRFELEKMPINDSISLPKHFSMKSKARIFFFFTNQKEVDETYFDYQKAVPTETAGIRN